MRCGFAHEYQPGKNATDSDALRGISGVGTNCISYVNQGPVGRRVIHFHLELISAVAQAVASGMDRECARQSKVIFENLGLSIPHLWWSDGAS